MKTFRGEVKAAVQGVKYRTDFDKTALQSNYDKRKWQKTTSDTDWNFFWASVVTVRQIFNPEIGYRLNDSQIINHFPNHVEMTRKDLMVKNIKRYRKELEREGNPLGARDGNGNYIYFDFVPSTYNLPSDFSLWTEEFKRHSDDVWILKPHGRAQGKGIVLANKIATVKRFMVGYSKGMRDTYIISKYLNNPLLVGGKKFDLRLYVLVTNYRPLKIYFNTEGFARFCNVKYTSANNSNIDNMFVHLTNVAIQKHGDDYNDKHGNKWSFKHLMFYLEATQGHEASKLLFHKIESIFVYMCKAVQNVMINDKHCFECYGFDIMIDKNLKPWLIEVNASPSLTSTTHADRIMKSNMINDIMETVVPPDFPESKTSRGFTSWNQKPVIGNFRLIYDEATGFGVEKFLSKQPGKEKAPDSKTRNTSQGGRW
eukprot:CAMPEP_0184481484 /NCGR_PEP_ID=MMETSP0113_2-20130426/3026_1 /TAXON_ID=91329 /ORGANISM="Norrisiella sphaerica, Strain BC52" /LENGTH=425 /DNA_ID=CAMNT_0026860635 /DNA_START=81 /DNA_END=1355 /DNA_ORIENTATION=+